MKFVFFFIVSLFLCSCADPRTQSILDETESLIHTHPDSALTILRTINSSTLHSKRQQARHSLLHAMALDKNYIDTTDISVIRPAVEYYSRHGSPTDKMKAYFYQGCIYMNQGEDDRALHFFLLSLEDSSKVTDNRCKELVNSAISDIFSRNHNVEQELLYTKDALRYGRLAGDSVGVWAITGHLASCYANNRRWEEAKSTYHSFFTMPIYDSIAYTQKRINYAKDLLRTTNPDPEKSIAILKQIAFERPSAMSVEAYCIYAYAHQLLGDEKIANEIIRYLEDLGQQMEIVRLWRYRIFRKQGHYKQAIADLEQTVLAQDSIVLESLKQSLIQSQHKYLQAQITVLKKQNIVEKQRNAFIALILFLILGIVVYLFFKRKKTLNRKLEELSALHQESQFMLALQNARAESVNIQLEQKEAALLSLRRQFASMYKAQYKILNDLCSAYFSPIKKDRKDIVYEEVLRQMDFIVNNKQSQDKFMTLVNKSLDNIIEKLRNDIPNHKEQDYIFMMYIIIGFDATTISNLMGYSVSSVYTKKNRLKRKIQALTSPYKDFYLDYIS